MFFSHATSDNELWRTDEVGPGIPESAMAIDDLQEEEPVTGNGLPQLGGKGVPVGAPSSPSEKRC